MKRVTLECAECLQPFQVWPSDAVDQVYKGKEYPKRKYCGAKCAFPTPPPRLTHCLWCREPFAPERITNRGSKRAPQYCNTSCANSARHHKARQAKA
jgi:hypothetical protein